MSSGVIMPPPSTGGGSTISFGAGIGWGIAPPTMTPLDKPAVNRFIATPYKKDVNIYPVIDNNGDIANYFRNTSSNVDGGVTSDPNSTSYSWQGPFYNTIFPNTVGKYKIQPHANMTFGGSTKAYAFKCTTSGGSYGWSLVSIDMSNGNEATVIPEIVFPSATVIGHMYKMPDGRIAWALLSGTYSGGVITDTNTSYGYINTDGTATSVVNTPAGNAPPFWPVEADSTVSGTNYDRIWERSPRNWIPVIDGKIWLQASAQGGYGARILYRTNNAVETISNNIESVKFSIGPMGLWLGNSGYVFDGGVIFEGKEHTSRNANQVIASQYGVGVNYVSWADLQAWCIGIVRAYTGIEITV